MGDDHRSAGADGHIAFKEKKEGATSVILRGLNTGQHKPSDATANPGSSAFTNHKLQDWGADWSEGWVSATVRWWLIHSWSVLECRESEAAAICIHYDNAHVSTVKCFHPLSHLNGLLSFLIVTKSLSSLKLAINTHKDVPHSALYKRK